MPVDSYPEGVSGFGVYNMAGNVFEWVADWYDPKYYKESLALNPQGPDKGYNFANSSIDVEDEPHFSRNAISAIR